MRRFAILALLTLSLAACETVAGMGRDISNGAEAMQRTF